MNPHLQLEGNHLKKFPVESPPIESQEFELQNISMCLLGLGIHEVLYKVSVLHYCYPSFLWIAHSQFQVSQVVMEIVFEKILLKVKCWELLVIFVHSKPDLVSDQLHNCLLSSLAGIVEVSPIGPSKLANMFMVNNFLLPISFDALSFVPYPGSTMHHRPW